MNLASLLGSGIKSIQRGVASVSFGTNNITVTAVVTGKAELRLLGFSSSNVYVRLTSATNIAIDATTSGSVSWELTEFY